MSTSAAQQPSPQLFFQTINAHQRTEALKAGIELGVFTAIGEGNTTAAEIAKRCETSERGMRIPRSDVSQRFAISAAVVLPSPIAVNTPSSIPALRASV